MAGKAPWEKMGRSQGERRRKRRPMEGNGLNEHNRDQPAWGPWGPREAEKVHEFRAWGRV